MTAVRDIFIFSPVLTLAVEVREECVVCCVLCVMCCVLCVVCCALCVVYCVFCSVCCVCVDFRFLEDFLEGVLKGLFGSLGGKGPTRTPRPPRDPHETFKKPPKHFQEPPRNPKRPPINFDRKSWLVGPSMALPSGQFCHLNP